MKCRIKWKWGISANKRNVHEAFLFSRACVELSAIDRQCSENVNCEWSFRTGIMENWMFNFSLIVPGSLVIICNYTLILSFPLMREDASVQSCPSPAPHASSASICDSMQQKVLISAGLDIINNFSGKIFLTSSQSVEILVQYGGALTPRYWITIWQII